MGRLKVLAGVTLTIAHGSVIKVKPGSSLRIDGVLTTSGTGAPVIMTTLADDSIGGDTNGDGDATDPNDYTWEGITGDGAIPWSDLDLRYVG